MATNIELLQRVYAELGSEIDTGLARPLVQAMFSLAFVDLAHLLVTNDKSLAQKLVQVWPNQNYSSGKFQLPSDMVFHGDAVIRIDFAGTIAHRVTSRAKLELASTLTNNYYAVEGEYAYLKKADGTTSGTDLGITYFRIPTISDIDEELMPLMVQLVIARVAPTRVPKLKLEDMKHESK